MRVMAPATVFSRVDVTSEPTLSTSPTTEEGVAAAAAVEASRPDQLIARKTTLTNWTMAGVDSEVDERQIWVTMIVSE